MKSAAATIGATELSNCAKTLEDSYEQQQRSDRDEALAAFTIALRRVLTSFDRWPETGWLQRVNKVVQKSASFEVQMALIERLESLLKHDDAAAGRLALELRSSLN
jgi:HPt (histidine-containing phosphotransfer) domain-containing protein